MIINSLMKKVKKSNCLDSFLSKWAKNLNFVLNGYSNEIQIWTDYSPKPTDLKTLNLVFTIETHLV
jgi:hypothetical protein